MADINIRKAKKTDAKRILQLMKQQAAEQSTVLPPHLTCEAVEENGWGPAAVLVAFVAEHKGAKEGELEGYILAHHAYAIWDGHAMYIREIYVVPAVRRLGVAMRLCTGLLQAALSMGCKLCDVNINKANKAAVGLFEKLGAQNITKAEDWHLLSVDGKAMTELIVKCEVQGPLQMRPAVPEDMASVMVMIQELADHENMPDAPNIDAHTLVADSAPRGSLFECFVVEDEGTLAGYVVLYYSFSCQGRDIYMEDLYVKPGYRGQRLGKALVAQVAKCGHAREARNLEFCCLSWNTSALAFYERMGATNLTTSRGSQLYRFVTSAMRTCVQH